MPGKERPVIVAAPDSFKGSCTADAAARAMIAGAREVLGDAAEYIEIPLADGGEGTLDGLLAAWGVEARDARVLDALGRPRTARYGVSADGATAIIEAAEANGLPWVSDEALRPLEADTFGVGQLVLDALDHGVTEILLSVGGSATSEGGTGILRALGVRFLDAGGNDVKPGAAGLSSIAAVDATGLDPRAQAATWKIAVDVGFPLCGPDGAAAVFGPQKGASTGDIDVIDAGLARLATVLAERNDLPAENYTNRPGFGAAGGIALTAVALLGAETVAGADLVSEAIGLPELLARATLVLTGEGQLDAQSVNGKVVDLVARTRPAGVPLVVIAGSVALTAAESRAAGITAAFSIAAGPTGLADLVAAAEPRISETSANVVALAISQETTA
ncbi:glycerate kinase [Leucobacter aridicollis]|uniref:glycerate kinase n=1 Tax=Leucobacter aridicollis TaxID=283878 RepID=UPI00210621F7|nr:glycerate kinase [Leucobacter aridicollis]UTX52827.1 glycerate kinase [Leucobacter aridicollis]